MWPHRGMSSVWNYTWYLMDAEGFNKLADTSEASREDQFEKWSEELAISVERRNETRRRHNDDDDDDEDSKDDDRSRRRHRNQNNDSRLEPLRRQIL